LNTLFANPEHFREALAFGRHANLRENIAHTLTHSAWCHYSLRFLPGQGLSKPIGRANQSFQVISGIKSLQRSPCSGVLHIAKSNRDVA